MRCGATLRARLTPAQSQAGADLAAVAQDSGITQMLLTETEQTETLFAMVLFGLVAIAGIALLVAVTIDNAL
jgi:hypothetical protein